MPAQDFLRKRVLEVAFDRAPQRPGAVRRVETLQDQEVPCRVAQVELDVLRGQAARHLPDFDVEDLDYVGAVELPEYHNVVNAVQQLRLEGALRLVEHVALQPVVVGIRRLLAKSEPRALAVGRLYGTPAIVVDFGTATTFDCVSRDGAYVGGAIAPGLELGIEALAARTARLPQIELKEPEKAIGTDTVSAMQSGVVIGYRALTVGLLDRIKLELARTEKVDLENIQVVLTGGLSAAPWARGLLGVDAIDPELTIKGLAIMWALANGSPAIADTPAVGWAGSAAGSIHIISERDK